MEIFTLYSLFMSIIMLINSSLDILFYTGNKINTSSNEREFIWIPFVQTPLCNFSCHFI